MQEVELKPKNVFMYATLPGVFPRLKTLFSHFYYLPMFLASLYKNLGLLPATHPYLNMDNYGRFGIVSLVSVAANELTFDRKNIDKIVVFGATLLTFFLFILFAFGFAFSFFSNSAHALMATVITASPATDIAFEILDRIFGIPGVYNSGYAATVPVFPTPFQVGLHSMLAFYNTALWILAGFIFLYYIVSIVGETAFSGNLFGERFHKIWGPLRLVLALGLLVPMGNYGLNSAQYILLYVAKYGSGVATNVWLAFNAAPGVTSPFGTGAPIAYQGPNYSYTDVNGNAYTQAPSYSGGGSYVSNGLIVHPQAPDVSGLIAYANLIHTCIYAYKQMYDIDIQPYFVKVNAGAGLSQLVFSSPGVVNFNDALTFYGTSDVYIYFGHKSITDYPKLTGNVRPYCGDLVFPYKNLTIPQLQTALGWAYYVEVMTLFSEPNPLIFSTLPEIQRPQTFGYKIVAHKLQNKGYNLISPCGLGSSYTGLGACNNPELSPNHRAFSTSEFRRVFNDIVDLTISGLMTIVPSPFTPTAADLNRGWVTAGIWYNKISEWNGDVVIGVSAIPHPGKFPEVMEKSKEYKLSTNPNTDPLNIFQPVADGNRNVKFDNEQDRQISSTLLVAYDYWTSDGGADPRNMASKANPFEGSLASIFGLTPILTIREQDHLHPLAQLSSIGRNLIENAITNLTLAAGASFIGGTMNAAGEGLGSAFTGMAGFFSALSFIGILLGVVLYYIVPFMPFLYSFFAASGWIKSIFEAMVGVPLWALAHLKLKGDSLFSKEAQSGYYLLLEIFIRPTLILFGLIASTAIFSASVAVLNNIWDLVTDNLSGVTVEMASLNNPLTMGYHRNNVDQFFFLVMYIIVVYMIGTSSFKLIDQIPHSVIRWINAGVKSFGDMAKDPADGLYRYASMATYRFAPAIGQGVSTVGEALGKGVGGATGLGGVVGANTSSNIAGFSNTATGLGKPPTGTGSGGTTP